MAKSKGKPAHLIIMIGVPSGKLPKGMPKGKPAARPALKRRAK